MKIAPLKVLRNGAIKDLPSVRCASCLQLECPDAGVLSFSWGRKLWKIWHVQSQLSEESTRGLLATDHVILNHGQVTWTTPELAPPLLTTTPHQREDVSALDRFNVHRCPTRRVFSGTGLELMTYLPWLDTLTTGLPQPCFCRVAEQKNSYLAVVQDLLHAINAQPDVWFFPKTPFKGSDVQVRDEVKQNATEELNIIPGNPFRSAFGSGRNAGLIM
ncbi:uncharacterized protein TNCV_778121 [Trichonephila clavipes]|nr:uncharacterized protein TNCV_778121 [Trichonephila clavipes]